MSKKEELQEEMKKHAEYSDILDILTSDGELKDNKIPELEIPKKAKNITINIGEVSKKCNVQAKSYITSLINFYLGDDMKKVMYMKNKINDDIATLSDMLLQMKTSEFGILKMVEMANEGDVPARHFEYLANLQKAKMEIVKYYESVKMVIENNYKGFIEDYNAKEEAKLQAADKFKSFKNPTKSLNPFVSETKIDEVQPAVEVHNVEEVKEVQLPKGLKINPFKDDKEDF